MQITYGPKSEQTGGLTATANGSVKSTADEAYVVVIPEQLYGPNGPEPISGEDRADVIEAIEQTGIATDDIEIISGRQPYEPVQISVEVEVADLPEIGGLILDAVEDVLRRSEHSGVRLSPNPPMRSGLGVGTRGEGRGTRRSALDSDKWGRWRPLVVVGGADGGPGQRPLGRGRRDSMQGKTIADRAGATLWGG